MKLVKFLFKFGVTIIQTIKALLIALTISYGDFNIVKNGSDKYFIITMAIFFGLLMLILILELITNKSFKELKQESDIYLIPGFLVFVLCFLFNYYLKEKLDAWMLFGFGLALYSLFLTWKLLINVIETKMFN